MSPKIGDLPSQTARITANVYKSNPVVVKNTADMFKTQRGSRLTSNLSPDTSTEKIFRHTAL